MGMGKYDSAPYTRGGCGGAGAEVDCECIIETGGGPEGPAPHHTSHVRVRCVDDGRGAGVGEGVGGSGVGARVRWGGRVLHKKSDQPAGMPQAGMRVGGGGTPGLRAVAGVGGCNINRGARDAWTRTWVGVMGRPKPADALGLAGKADAKRKTKRYAAVA